MRRLVVGAALAGAVAASAAPAARAEIDITPVTSPGGISAWLSEDHSIPIITLEASFEGGALHDPDGKEGVVALMTALLDEGAGDLDATAFAEAREALAVRFGFAAGADAVSVSADMLSAVRDDAVALLRSALVAPRFDAAAFERARARTLSRLASEETDPNAIASREFYARLFAGHPYARPRNGTRASVETLAREDIRTAHGRALVRAGLTVSVAGDITPEELGPLLDDLFGDLPAGALPEPGVADVHATGGLTVLDLDTPQSVVLFGDAGIARDDPDFLAAYMMNHMLGGGGFSSRLTDELREQRGLTYGVYSALMPNRHGWLISGRFSTTNARVAEAIGLIRAEWQRMAANGVTDAELAAAKRYLTGAYPLRFDGNRRIAGQLQGLQTAGLPHDYVNLRNDLVEAVTAEDIARVAAQLLRPEALTFVVVGRPEGLDPVN
jgi:zinc protease